mgnify:CR=1 FL=1|tara:strand:- start:200 stop:502 length:303 start_codon:yes stop_codon:yes gene_type:complete
MKSIKQLNQEISEAEARLTKLKTIRDDIDKNQPSIIANWGGVFFKNLKITKTNSKSFELKDKNGNKYQFGVSSISNQKNKYGGNIYGAQIPIEYKMKGKK